MSKLNITSNEPEPKTVYFAELKVGDFFMPTSLSCFDPPFIFQKSAFPGWRPMATNIANGKVQHMLGTEAIQRVEFSLITSKGNEMSKLVPILCGEPKKTTPFRDLQIGEVFRLESGEKLMMKIARRNNGDTAIYLHSASTKSVGDWDSVVRRKVSLQDFGDES